MKAPRARKAQSTEHIDSILDPELRFRFAVAISDSAGMSSSCISWLEVISVEGLRRLGADILAC
eukprot:CAMPEP_0206216908 /NCGR_PEP_ID=MMETSP0047_2-20121206/2984_1 /ASSEMBLY_ACC=CAM_ASM_000192 /TAXON_ID=195065 /ORGANISM="Chroomonas mesostigmatica_cf, Strain CCMP1168" /LENGTH=63 /DNA_ID=CAMNT_0053639311 /DNA_START=509 /DNA_END=697 /DNA_ORIENTATION=-